MVDNAGLGPAYAYGSPDIPPKTAACSSSRRSDQAAPSCRPSSYPVSCRSSQPRRRYHRRRPSPRHSSRSCPRARSPRSPRSPRRPRPRPPESRRSHQRAAQAVPPRLTLSLSSRPSPPTSSSLTAATSLRLASPPPPPRPPASPSSPPTHLLTYSADEKRINITYGKTREE